jgi:arylsulfatase A-like enzyme
VNVVLVALDTLRAAQLGCYGYRYPTSPTLDAVAAEGVRFENFYAPAIPTQPSYTTVYTGQHSITHNIVTHGGDAVLDRGRPWLPSIFARAGVATCAVDNLVQMKPWFLDGYEHYLNATLRRTYPQSVECPDINRLALPWIRHHADQPFFLFVHYWDPHTPYLPPEEYRPLFYEGDPCDPARKGRLHRFYETSFHAAHWRDGFIRKLAPEGKEITDIEYLRAMYDAEIRYLDDGIAELLGALDEAGVADDTMVLFFADHGEEMYEHDVFFDHHGLYEGNIHCPLIIRWPGKARPGHVVPHLVQHVDLAPTILEAAGLDVPPEMEGRSLVPCLTGETDEPIYDVLVTQECTYQKKWGIVKDSWKLIVSRCDPAADLHKMPPLELYDLTADPGEMQNVADERPDRVRALRARLEGWIDAMIARHDLPGDPLALQDITIGNHYARWLAEHNYW